MPVRIYQPTAHSGIVCESLNNGKGDVFKAIAKFLFNEIRGNHFESVFLKFTKDVWIVVEAIANSAWAFGSQLFDVCGPSGLQRQKQTAEVTSLIGCEHNRARIQEDIACKSPLGVDIAEEDSFYSIATEGVLFQGQ